MNFKDVSGYRDMYGELTPDIVSGCLIDIQQPTEESDPIRIAVGNLARSMHTAKAFRTLTVPAKPPVVGD